MTRALNMAIAKLTTLPAEEQDRIAQWLLDELGDEEYWTRQFAASQDALGRLADEARAERAAGRSTELDPDKALRSHATPALLGGASRSAG